MTKSQWHKENCLIGFITTCHTRKIEASFEGYQLKGIYSSNNGFEVLYQKDGQILSAIFPDRSHAEYFAEVFK